MDHHRERGVVDVFSLQVIEHYLCTIFQKLDIQRRHNEIIIQKLYLMTNIINFLVTLVGQRKERVL